MEHVVQHWYDPETKQALQGPTEEDSWGTDLIGQDSEGRWWGTPRALWVISPGRGCKTFVVTGYLGSETYVLYLRAKHKSVALDYAICHGVKDPLVTEGRT